MGTMLKRSLRGLSRERRDSEGDPVSLHLELADDALDLLADRLAERLQGHPEATASPWMDFEGLCEYAKIPEGTLRKMTAAGEIPSHGGRTRIYHRDEVDEALLGYSRSSQSTHLRRVS